MSSRRNYPTRLETRTKEFNWIASRRVHFSQCSHGEAKANSYDVKLTILLQYRLITYEHRAFVLCVHFLLSFGIVERLIKLKSTLVETRKMVNFARTW